MSLELSRRGGSKVDTPGLGSGALLGVQVQVLSAVRGYSSTGRALSLQDKGFQFKSG